MKIGEKLPFWRSITTTSQTTETRWKRKVGAVVTGSYGGGAARSIFAIRTTRDLGFVTFVGSFPFRFSTFISFLFVLACSITECELPIGLLATNYKFNFLTIINL